MSCCSTMAAAQSDRQPGAGRAALHPLQRLPQPLPVYGAIGGHAYGATYPGPLGAALDPGLDGLEKTEHLPNATSFCGRCDPSVR